MINGYRHGGRRKRGPDYVQLLWQDLVARLDAITRPAEPVPEHQAEDGQQPSADLLVVEGEVELRPRSEQHDQRDE